MLLLFMYEAITNESLDPWNVKFSMKICDKHSVNSVCNVVFKSAMGTAELQGYV
jgi:hypothetical protein